MYFTCHRWSKTPSEGDELLNKALIEPDKDMEFEARVDKEYEVEAIIYSAIYSQQANNNQKPGLYYLILWKGYLEEENT